MKAYLISEILSFNRSNNNPLDKLNIGRIEDRVIENFMKAIKKIGIKIEKKSSVTTEGVWDFYLKDKEYSEIDYDNYYIFYTPEKVAEREGWEDQWGFFISDEKDGSILIGPTKDWKELVNFLNNERNKIIKKLHESLSFNRSNINPLNKLNIGRIEERNIENFIEALNKIGITATKEIYGLEGVWIFDLEDQQYGKIWGRYKVLFISEKAAEQEGIDPGFFINTEEDTIVESKNWKDLIDYFRVIKKS
ncbi:MAG: hypothetical protein PHF86_02060 [Candidatus Nanoarchaeia archaeon]|nr:hypothetical protein [Candidatus Nanoarchaeia archaeon]